MNFSSSDYYLCVDLQSGHLQCRNHVLTDVQRRNNNSNIGRQYQPQGTEHVYSVYIYSNGTYLW